MLLKASSIQDVITRSKTEAIAILRGYRQQIIDREVNMADLAARESDCSSATKGGDLGRVYRGKMQSTIHLICILVMHVI